LMSIVCEVLQAVGLGSIIGHTFYWLGVWRRQRQHKKLYLKQRQKMLSGDYEEIRIEKIK